jgi:hypothetical protein
VLSGGGPGLDVLTERWAEEYGLPVERFAGGRDNRTEAPFLAWLLSSHLDGPVVFNGGANSETELARPARARGIAVRVVDARAIFVGRR